MERMERMERSSQRALESVRLLRPRILPTSLFVSPIFRGCPQRIGLLAQSHPMRKVTPASPAVTPRMDAVR